MRGGELSRYTFGQSRSSNKKIGATRMKRFLPGRTELAIFLTVALIGAAICEASQAHDLSMSVLAIPIFICAALMGMYRSGFLGKQFSQPVIYRNVETEDETAE
jgi:hypothetical protein